MRHFDFRLRPANRSLMASKKVRDYFKQLEKLIKIEIRTKKKMVGCLCGICWLVDKEEDAKHLSCPYCGLFGYVVDLD